MKDNKFNSFKTIRFRLKIVARFIITVDVIHLSEFQPQTLAMAGEIKILSIVWRIT